MSHLCENLEYGDLKRLIHPELHIDEYKSKMGDDADICVLSLKIKNKEPANDIVNFIEKGYDFVLDADVSSGEKEDGDYLVFIEIERNSSLPLQIINMMSDIMNLGEQQLSDWRVRYYKSMDDHDLTIESLENLIPLSADSYNKKFKIKELDKDTELDKLRTVAGIKVNTKAPDNELTESLRIAAGIR